MTTFLLFIMYLLYFAIGTFFVLHVVASCLYNALFLVVVRIGRLS